MKYNIFGTSDLSEDDLVKTIETVLKEFLVEQRQLLETENQEEYRDYEEVINLFAQFLNSYAYLNLGIEDAELFDDLYNNADKEYCDIFGPEYIGDSEVEEFCFIPKLFRVNYVGCNPSSIVKLNGKKIRWIIAQKLKGESTSTIAEIQGISARRVQQICKEYTVTGQVPEVGHNVGRPGKPLLSDDKELIDQAYADYKFGACYLEIILRAYPKSPAALNVMHAHAKCSIAR